MPTPTQEQSSTMLPEVKAYFDAIDSKNHRIESARVREAHRVPDWDPTMSSDQVAAYFEADDKRHAAVRALEKVHKEKQAEAYQHLITSENPVVRFLVTDPEVRRYPEHAEAVLKALPMSREEMEEFGDSRDWCGEYARLFKRAQEVGVLPEPVPDLADVEPLVEECARWFGGSERRLRTIIKKHLPHIIASATAKDAQQAQEGLQATA